MGILQKDMEKIPSGANKQNSKNLYKIECDVGANKNAGQAFSMPRLSSHFMLYQVSGFRFFSPSNQDSLIPSLYPYSSL